MTMIFGLVYFVMFSLLLDPASAASSRFRQGFLHRLGKKMSNRFARGIANRLTRQFNDQYQQENQYEADDEHLIGLRNSPGEYSENSDRERIFEFPLEGGQHDGDKDKPSLLVALGKELMKADFYTSQDHSVWESRKRRKIPDE